jgi:hypothetical protein
MIAKSLLHKRHSKWIKPKYWRGFFWLHSLALIADGLIYLLSFGFYYSNFDWDFIVWNQKQYISKLKKKGYE